MDHKPRDSGHDANASDHFGWFARYVAAFNSATSIDDLMSRAAAAVEELTGYPTSSSASWVTIKGASDPESVPLQIFSADPTDDSAPSLVVHAGSIPAGQAGAIQRLLAIVGLQIQKMTEASERERLMREESVISELLTMLEETADRDELIEKISALAESTFPNHLARVANQIPLDIHSVGESDHPRRDLDHQDARFVDRFVQTIKTSNRLEADTASRSSNVDHLSTLNDVTLAAASTHNLRQLYQAVRSSLARALPLDVMLIAMIPAGEEDAVTVFKSERDTSYFERTDLSPPFQMAMRLGKPFIVDDMPEHLYAPHYRFGDQGSRVRSLAGAPLVSNGTIAGLIVVQSYQPFTYHIEHANLLIDVGRNIAVALERANLLDRLRTQAERETALRTVAEQLTTTLDAGELLKIAVSETASILSHSLMAAISVDDTTPPAVTHIAAHGSDSVMATVGINSDSQLDPAGIAAQVVRTYQLVSRTEEDRSIIALPLIANQSCVGVLIIARPGHDPFSDDERALLGMLSNTLASALRIARLYTNRTQHEDDLLEVQRVSRLVSSSLDTDEILTEIIASAPRLFDAEGCSVRMVDDDHLVPLAEFGDIVHTFESRIPIATSLAGTIIRDRKVVAVNDLHTHPVTGAHARSKGIAVRGWAGAPMIDSDNQPIGILSIHSDHPRQWSERDLVLLQTLAGSTAVAIQNAWRFERTRNVLLASIESLAAAVDAKDPTTLNHSRNVSDYARLIAEAMGCDDEVVEQIALAGLLHDVGKIGIPDRILQKPDELDTNEWERMRTHSVIGEQILSGNPHLAPILPMVRHHHERWDGQGYPDGLEGAEIPLGAAIVALADAVETMSSDRPYQSAVPWAAMREIISENAGSQFHPQVAATFARLAENGEIEPVMHSGLPSSELAHTHLPRRRGHSLDARALMIVHGVAREVRALTDLNTFIVNVANVIRDVMELTDVEIFLTDEVRGEITYRATAEDRIRGRRDVRRKIGDGVVGWVAEHGKPLLVPDVALDKRFIPSPNTTTRSELAVPLIADGAVVGVINVEAERVAAFSDMDEHLLVSTADHLAQTIQVARLHDRFKHLASTDALTGLANHRAFYERLDEEIRHAALTDGVLTVAIMDVDQLKKINDTYGHLTGDATLREIAGILRDRCRRSDLVCRYGGDEFAVILGDTDLVGANRVMANIIEGLAAGSVDIDGQRKPLPTGAWGMATYPDDGMRPAELVRVADSRMYSHKRFSRAQDSELVM